MILGYEILWKYTDIKNDFWKFTKGGFQTRKEAKKYIDSQEESTAIKYKIRTIKI